MADEDPITKWIAALKNNDPLAAQAVWERYWRRVAGLARKVLAARSPDSAAVEDVAQSAFRTFFLRARDGRFPRLGDRRDLWNLLAVITVRKAVKQRRGAGPQPDVDVELLSSELSGKPSHETVVAVKDEVQRLLDLLDDPSRQVLGYLLEGHTNQEIAKQLGVSLSTIERKRKLIRATWDRAMQP
jgi:RNA polymerase sigma factor (sigma-70 family)